MLDKMPLNRQLMLSFGMILAIFAIVSLVSYNGLNQGFTNFKDYRGLARDTNLAARLQMNMLHVRLDVAKYLENGSEETLVAYNMRRENMESFLKQSQQEIKDPARLKNVNQSIDLFEEYKQGFTEVVYLIKQRNRVVNHQLTPSGEALEQAMSKLIEVANSGQDQ